ncbi:MAG: hypothetical protein HPY76_02580 [Anaerolineae bacterium]|nr:hypothetical protein [Anaerolineae bacterium]
MKSKRILSMTLALTLLLAACVPQILPPAPTAELGAMATAVAATVNAQMTQNAITTMIAELTQAALASATPLPSETSLPTETPPPTMTPTPGNTATLLASSTSTLVPTIQVTVVNTATKVPTPCNQVQFVADVTVPDGTTFAPNAAFTKSWRLKNAGTCAWTTDYALVYVSGAKMNAPDVIGMGTVVNPGQTVDLSVSLTAPSETGSYRGNWQLRSSTGVLFGWGIHADKAFWVDIKVVKGSPTLIPGDEFDLVANYCSAEWRSTAGTLACPSGGQNFTNGSITYASAPKLEGGYQDDEPALITIPSNGAGGFIQGTYPEISIQSGDTFSALVGCLDGSPACNIMFQLNYSADGGPVQNLGSWTEVSEGKYTHINVNLSSLAGKDVALMLVVQNNGASTEDRAFWLSPRINR